MNICDQCGSMYQDELIEEVELCPACKNKAGVRAETLTKGGDATMDDTQLLAVLAKIDKADRTISALSKPDDAPGAMRWKMTLETFDTDPDVVIGEALTAAQGMIYGLLGENRRLRGRLDRYERVHSEEMTPAGSADSGRDIPE